MLRALGRTIAQLFDPALFGVLIASFVGAAAVLAGVWFAVAAVLSRITLSGYRWLDWLERILVGAGAIFLTAALYSAIVAAIAGFFVERVARAVERRYYPGLPPPRPLRLGEQIAGGASFLAAALAVNLLALPFYLIWGTDVPIFLGANGYLLGRQYFELAAQRHLDRLAVRRLWHRHRITLLVGGGAIAALSFVPLAGLLTPVLATAFMVHIVHGFPEFEGPCGGEPFGDTPGRPSHRP